MSVTTVAAITGVFSDGTTLPSGLIVPSPTFTGAVTGGVKTISAGGVPLIGLSSGSVAANGAISGITALPAVYPSAYCYFPANKLAASIAAGFYYCTFSSTTAGTAFLNPLPATGAPTIPASPTAVTAGQGAFTGDITEEFGITLTLPVMSATAAIRLAYGTAQTNNANGKTIQVRLSGNAGTIMFQQSCSSLANDGFGGVIANTGVQNKQIAYEYGAMGSNAGSIGVLGTADLSLGTATLVFSMTRATATDNLVLFPPVVEVIQ